MKISNINLRIIKDSREKDTLEAEFFSGKFKAVASVPNGKSKGKFEAFSIAPKIALQKFKEIKGKLLGSDFSSILEFDNFVKKHDATEDKSNLGGNLILVLSICFTKLLALFNNLETYQLIEKTFGRKINKFPFLYFNLIGGGLHAKNSLPFQEYILVTKLGSPMKELEYARLVVEKLKLDLAKNFGESRFGDEGAFAIKNDDPSLGLEILNRNLNNPNVSLALDVAASTFYENGVYKIGEKTFDTQQMLVLYQNLATKFPLLSIEDPFSEDDKPGFVQTCRMFENKTWVIGDDLTVTNVELIQKAVGAKEITGVIIKPNQIGTISETLDAIQLAQSHSLKILVSHRSGETNDDFIADLAFGSGADGLKSGSPTQPQRLAKYNRLIEIEKTLMLQ